MGSNGSRDRKIRISRRGFVRLSGAVLAGGTVRLLAGQDERKAGTANPAGGAEGTTGGGEEAEQQVRRVRHQERGGEAGVPAEHRAAEQFPAPGLLLGAGVPDDGEQADHPDDHREEAAALGKPTLVLREKTERPEAVAAGVVRLVGTNRERIVAEASRLLSDPQAYQAMARPVHVYGDGHAAPRISEVLLDGRITSGAFVAEA